ncbi:MAG TPA: hypothetical protein VJ725_30945 [Thermoanaerobaculia bacterium]|nr:hypothetical protein [Thermoanaerobaculia bacterium]
MAEDTTASTPVEISPDVSPQDFVKQWAASNGTPSLDTTETTAPAEQTSTDPPKPAETEKPADEDKTPPAKPAPAATAEEVDPLADPPESTDIAIQRARKLREDADRKLAQARREIEDANKALAHQLRTNPRAALAKLGVDLGELIDADLAVEPDKTEAKAAPNPEIEDLKKRLASFEMQATEAKVQAAIAKIHSDVKADVRFPLINRLGEKGLEMVTDRIVSYHQEHGSRITGEQAAKLVELDLREQVKLLGIQTDATKVPAPAKPAPAKDSAQPQKTGSTTLTNTEVRDAVTEESETVPEDPRQLVKFWATRVKDL